MKALKQAQLIYQCGVTAARNGVTITYRDVLNELGYSEKVSGQAIRYGLELAWIACADKGLPSITSIIVNKGSGSPSGGYAVDDWEKDKDKVFAQSDWPALNDFDWDYIWVNRAQLSDKYGTRGYWIGK